MCDHCEYSKSSEDSDSVHRAGATVDRQQLTYRVRELVCSYRPARSAKGRVLRVSTDTLADPRQAASVLAPLVSGQVVEVLGVAYLSTRNKCLAWHVVSRGHRNGTMLSMADALGPACVTPGTVAMIVVHNHPSGDPTPSPDDIAVTRRLESAASLLGFSLLDHLVIGDEGRYYSFREGGLLPRSSRT